MAELSQPRKDSGLFLSALFEAFQWWHALSSALSGPQRILSGFPGVRLRSPLAKVCRPIRDKMRASLVKLGCPQVLRHFSSSSTDSQADIPSPSTSLRRRLFGANYSTQLPARAYIRLDEAERSARIRDSGSQQPHGCSK